MKDGPSGVFFNNSNSPKIKAVTHPTRIILLSRLSDIIIGSFKGILVAKIQQTVRITA